jgi:hypothetical protein
MTTTARQFPEVTGRDCYDWIGAEDVMRHALAAFYKVCREQDQQPDDPTGLEAWHNNGRHQLAVYLVEVFEARIFEAGSLAGVPGFTPRHSENTLPALSRPENLNIGDTQDIHRTQ